MCRLKLNDILPQINSKAELSRSDHYDYLLKYFKCKKNDLWGLIQAWKQQKHMRKQISDIVKRVVGGEKLIQFRSLNLYEAKEISPNIISSKKSLLNMRKKHEERKKDEKYVSSGTFAIKGNKPDIKHDGRKSYQYVPSSKVFKDFYMEYSENYYPYTGKRWGGVAKTTTIIEYTSYCRILNPHKVFIRSLENKFVLKFPKNIFFGIGNVGERRLYIFDKKYPLERVQVKPGVSVKEMISEIQNKIKEKCNSEKEKRIERQINLVRDEDIFVLLDTIKVFYKKHESYFEIQVDSQEQLLLFTKKIVNRFGNKVSFNDLKNFISTNKPAGYIGNLCGRLILDFVEREEKLKYFKQNRLTLLRKEEVKLEYM